MSLAYVIVNVLTGTPLQRNQLAVPEGGPQRHVSLGEQIFGARLAG